MFRNYLKTALRNLWRHRGFTAINIVGLSVGMTACLLIFLYVSFECNYDRFHDKADRIYRITTDIKTASEIIPTSSTSFPMALSIKRDFPEVELSTSFYKAQMLIRNGERKFQEKDVLLADSTCFTMFNMPLSRGTAAEVFKTPYEIVLSERAAEKYFGNEDPINRVLTLDDSTALKVTGVMKNMPENSQFKTDVLLPMSLMSRGLETAWGNFGWQAYILLKPGADYKKLEAKLPGMLEDRVPKDQRVMSYTLHLEPLKDVYLVSDRGGYESGNITNVYIFSVVGIFILVIACINFVNLTTARASERAKEVGVRKVIGATRRELATQFLGESIVICVISFFLALMLAALVSPLFNALCGKQVSVNLFSHGRLLLMLLAIALLIGVLAGVYPALVLSQFKPISVLKGRFVSTRSGLGLRKTLVVVQFTVSIILIAGTIIVYKQLYFMRHQEMGFANGQQLIVSYYEDQQVNKQLPRFKHELAQIPGVEAVSASMAGPGTPQWGAFTEIENRNGELQSANLDLYNVDFGFLEQLGVKMRAGRMFDVKYSTDSTEALVINETAARVLGYPNPEEVVGKKFSQWGRNGRVIGVVKDFNYRSLRDTVKALSIRVAPENCAFFLLKLKAGDPQKMVAAVERKWQELAPHRPFDYTFLDENFDKQYTAETRFSRLFFYFAGLAIVISCLGLLGLAAYSTVQRTREIGIRKVLGASMGNITALLSKEFVVLVLIALCIASPVAWYAMDRWADGFAYRAPISWWVFAVAGVLAIAIALLTVSFHAIKAAIVNPVKSLRSE
ncbi:ABC transporter permease [Chitinophaga horti]|uniref:ABC transporter permease n=1 Tax=Chitinophaga horti TaxID=2920382 RepID=A0ABY6IX64_9BACT|nr:ABC transporter permease [Chitinophaga horti]UYQ91786.1 ABC transporter permease [Chitinophaga horti]